MATTVEVAQRVRRLRVPRSTLLRHLAVGVVGLAVLVAFTSLLPAFRDLQVADIGYQVCAVAGLTVVTGWSGQISLGQGALVAVGAYSTALLVTHQHLPLVVVLILSVLITALVGALVGAAAARLRGPYLAGATLALAVGLPALAFYPRIEGSLGGNNGLSINNPAPPAGFGANFPAERWQAWICCLAAVIVLVLLANLSRSRIGRSFRAVRDDEVAASLAGLHVARTQILAFVVSAGCAGLGGGLLALVSGVVAPGAFPLALSLELLAAIVLGGLGSLAGAVYGSVILVLLPTWASDLSSSLSLPSKISNNLPLAIYGLVLVVAILVFPRGIQGGLRRLVPLWRQARRRIGGDAPG